MADVWEMAYFKTVARDGTGNWDGDGMNDADEFVVGTDPTNDASFPAAFIRLQETNVLVEFDAPAASGLGYDGMQRWYALQSDSSLPARAWASVPGFDRLVGDNSPHIHTNAGASSGLFYRLSIRLEPTP